MIPIVRQMIATRLRTEPLWWGLIISANLGGNGTPIGSISCVIALHALHESTGRKFGWGTYLDVGGLALAIQLVLVLGFLHVFTALDLFPAIPPGG